ncbi:sulfur oxidation c-type cytochrome SoxX [Hydrogenophaga sp. 5NK40-0174]|uniref:sulfur oxidation c-type cytochrome SoxX n=1 Tax=Hydrogenophaga sp. 5NK40-0174 TaxID=3127649 RepID=UPI003102FDD5
MTKTKIASWLAMPVAAAALAACTVGGGSAAAGTDYDAMTAKVAKESFQDKGIAKVERLKQDEANRLCSAADVAGKPLDESSAKMLEAAQMKTIQWPSDGKFLGNWEAGEEVAQSGKGETWRDKAGDVNGGNCYNCHQLTKEEISFGTIGPSLYNYGKLRGVTDPNSAAAQEVVKYTWGKLYNARAYSACSLMPRFGHNGILKEQQLKDIMALLLDPKSPVNQ